MALELKELAAKIKTLFRAEENEDFHLAATSVLSSPGRDEIFDRYVELTGGLEIDHLQRIHQFWHADRSEKKQDFTPPSIAMLAATLTTKEGRHYTLYDVCAGSGALTIAHWRVNKSIEVQCEELDERLIPLLLFNLAIRNIPGYVLNKNILTGETYKAYRLTRGEKYSAILEAEPPQPQQYDAVVSNPPYNIPWTPVTDERFLHCEESLMKLKSNANFAFVLHALHYLKQGGTAALILPNSVLVSTTPEEKIRAYLTEENILDAVISLPEKMFESTDISTCILTLKKAKTPEEKISIIDACETCAQENRDQRGEGSACHANRVYHKTRNVLLPEHISKIAATAENKNEELGFSAAVTVGDVRKNEYAYTPARYIKFKEEEHKHRPFQEIASDINKIVEERNKVKITVNENLAKELGLSEIAALIKQSNEITEEQNKRCAFLGLSFKKNDYLTLSKNAKEFKIENKCKEGLSSIFAILLPIFIPMYTQHIFYLNNRENELLAELRDAMLPGLMSGEIKVPDDIPL